MIWDKKTDRAVQSIYDGVDGADGWAPMLQVVAEEFDSAGAHLFMRHHTRGAIIEGGGLFADSSLESFALYDKLMRQAYAGYRLSSDMPLDKDLDAGLVVLRPRSIGAFEPQHVERLDSILSHLVRALRLQRRFHQLESDADNIVVALDRLPTAALIVTEALEVICLNRQADELLLGCETLDVQHGKLVAERAAEASALREAVGEAITLTMSQLATPIAPPRVVDITRPAKLPLDVLAVPLRQLQWIQRDTGKHSRVLLMIYDPESRPSVDQLLIERIFELTPTEAFVAARLAEGNSIAEIAKERRCSTSTVRTHVKHLFRKTHTNRQGELVQLILTSPAISFAG